MNKIKSIPNSAGNNSSTDDVFRNIFDITWAKTPDCPKEFSILPIEIATDDGLVSYRYNDEYFRCDNFADSHDGLHILFAGCSQTEGVGGNIETVWTKMLYDAIAEKNDVSGFFSIARAGWGWQKIISNFMIYTSSYGFPDYLFVLLPDISRFFEWDTRKNDWVYVQRQYFSRQEANGHYEKIFNQLATFEEHKKAFIDFCMGWKLFEEYCKLNNVKLLWGSWDLSESDNYKRFMSIENYVDISSEKMLEFIKTERPDGKMQEFDLTRRDGHEGILPHKYWASEFTKKINEKGWLNV